MPLDLMRMMDYSSNVPLQRSNMKLEIMVEMKQSIMIKIIGASQNLIIVLFGLGSALVHEHCLALSAMVRYARTTLAQNHAH